MEALFKHKHICFVQDHYNPLNIIRSLGEKGIHVIVILVSNDPCLINHSKYVKVLHKVKSFEDGYNILLLQYGNEIYKPFLYCGDDKIMSLLDNYYLDLKEKFIYFNAGGQGKINWLQNKDNITSLGEKVGLDCPKKEIVNKGVFPKTLKYPIITKVLSSTMGAWKGDVHICRNEKKLEEAYKTIQSPQLILQEYIEKVGEFCMEGFSINDGNDIFLPYVIDYIRYYNDSYGHFMKVMPFKDEELKSKIQELFRLAKYNGIFEIEFMKGPDGKNYFLEINFRASGWNYALTVGGGNLPYFWAKGMLTGKIHYEEMNLREVPFKAMIEPADFAGNVKKIGLIPWLKDLKDTECYYYYNKKDPVPFWSYLFRKLFKRNKSIE